MSSVPSFSLQIDHPAWKKRRVPITQMVTLIMEEIFRAIPKRNAALTLLLTSDKKIAALNLDFRGKDKPTNVLSFPDGEKDENGDVHLGDVVMSMDTLQAQARAQGKILEHHFAHLFLHGVLHLLGHDHEREKDAETMENLEIKLLRNMGIKNPYVTLTSKMKKATVE